MDRPDERDPLCWGWNPGPVDLGETAVAPRPGEARLLADGAADITQLAGMARSAPGIDLAGPMAAFTLQEEEDPIDVLPFATIGGGLGGPAPPPGPANVAPPPFPGVGEAIAGYRLISQLGRGTFGRVFLAEEALLGNRLVALKITRAEGDEPRLLARLQHTHIVPIHSVHDDPATGLRVMCMPYVGGANLAQVLDAASAARGRGQGEQRSLLRALDIVGLPPPSEVFTPAESLRRRSSAASPGPRKTSLSPRANRLGDPVPIAAALADTLVSSAPAGRSRPPARVPAAGSRRADAPSESWWPSLRDRFPGWSQSFRARRAWARDRQLADDRDPAQPARRFLREANFVRSAAWIVARLAEGLEHAHSHGLLHRDLKPSNILIAADGTPMLLDFNLAADTTAAPGEEDPARMGGTLPYMSPEHLDAFQPEGGTPAGRVDERSDIYALGLILFEMIAGHRPFVEPAPDRPPLDMIRTMIAERRGGAPSLRAAYPGVPRDLDAVVRKALHPDPERRHARAGDFAEDLRRFLGDLPLLHAAEPTIRGRVVKWARRNPRATGASTVGLVGLALIIGLSAATWSVTRHLNQASARLRLKAFEARFPECQFLLNTGGGPADGLTRGIALAREALGQAGIDLDADADAHAGPAGWFDLLGVDDRREVRRDVAELILLVARARVYLLDRAQAADKRPAIERAIVWLDRAEAIDPSPTLTLYDDRANYLDQVGQAGRAAADRARRDAIAPATGRDFYLLGTALMARGEPDRAEPALIRATGLTPQGFWPWFALGLCHYDQKRFVESAGDFAVCSALAPRFAWPWMNRGLALAQAGRLVEARSACDRAVEADGSNRDALANRGLVALELDDAPAALADLERAVALGRRDVDLQAALGDAMGRAGLAADAGRVLDRLVALHPDAVSPRIARGTLRLATDPAAAEVDFRRALAVAPPPPAAFLGLARLRRASDPAEALRFAVLALEADPRRIDAVELSSRLRGQLGDPAVILDVDRLVGHATPSRLYNAACALALYAEHHPDPALTDRAIACLRRAIQAGLAPAKIRDDPDLAGLRSRPAFRNLFPGAADEAPPRSA